MTTFRNSRSISPIPLASGARTAPPASRAMRIHESPDRKCHQHQLELCDGCRQVALIDLELEPVTLSEVV